MSSPAPDAAPAGKDRADEAGETSAAAENQAPPADTEAGAAAGEGLHAPAEETPDAADPPADAPADAAQETPANGLAAAQPEHDQPRAAAAKQAAATPAAAEVLTSISSGPLPPSTHAIATGSASDGPASPRPLPLTEQRSDPGLSEVSGGSGPLDVTGVAQDLERAEAQADRAALAEAARGASLGRRSGEAGAAAAAAGGESFTEEALQQEDLGPEATPSPEQPRGAPARPFSPPPRSATPASPAGGGESPEAFEPREFRGLVFHDGVDALGRPVVVVDADAVPPAVSRRAACAYMLQRLEPIVVQGPYVLVLLSTGRGSRGNRLPAGWLASSYRELSHPFRKNVKHVVLVRPSAALRFMLAIMRPLISRKAFGKLKRVESLSAIGPATNLEVTLQHLGPRFAAAAGQAILQAEGLGSGNGYAMPAMGSLELSQR